LTAIEPAAVIILSPSHHRRDVVLGLRLGADDAVSKPLDVDEFLARVEAVLRRVDRRAEAAEIAPPPARPPAHTGATILLDRRRGHATVSGRVLSLTPTEFRLLEVLLDHDPHYVPREQLIEAAWGQPGAGSSRALDVHVARLRSKLRAVSGPSTSIEAVRVPGYRLILTSGTPAADRSTVDLDAEAPRPRRPAS
jgi:two-component system alkaline phosphatase synthesis response regulator PhoP